MNSQALQKRIIDGKLYSHGPIGEWPNTEFRSSLGHATDDELSAGTTDAHVTQHPTSNTQDRKIRNWGGGSRVQHG
jgi:hypothetical protein